MCMRCNWEQVARDVAVGAQQLQGPLLRQAWQVQWSLPLEWRSALGLVHYMMQLEIEVHSVPLQLPGAQASELSVGKYLFLNIFF